MRAGLVGFAVGLLVAAIVCAWRAGQSSAPSIHAQPATELKGEKPRTLECRPVVVYREKVSDKLGIPKDAGHVTASAKIPASDHPYTATATYSEATGATSLYIRRDPLPWLDLTRSGELNLSYGAREGHSGAVARLGTRMDMVSIKSMRFGVSADVDSAGGWFAGVGVSVRF